MEKQQNFEKLKDWGKLNMKNKTISILHLLTVTAILVGCATASGSVIVTGVKRDPIDPSLVKLYSEAPSKYEVIGIVSASSDSGWTEQDSVDYAVEELKNQAAKLGANGILLEKIGEQKSTYVGGSTTGFIYAVPVTEKSVSGKAIYVRK